MIKLSSLLKEIRVAPPDDRLVIKLTNADEYGEARDKTTLIFPKHGSQLDSDDKAYIESEEVGIPEESGFFVYLDLALKDFENKIQQLGDNPDRSQVEDLIIELVKDLSKYIEENEAYSIDDTDPREGIANIIADKFEEIIPTTNQDLEGMGWYTFSNDLVKSLIEGDPSFLIDYAFGGNVNEIRVVAPNLSIADYLNSPQNTKDVRDWAWEYSRNNLDRTEHQEIYNDYIQRIKPGSFRLVDPDRDPMGTTDYNFDKVFKDPLNVATFNFSTDQVWYFAFSSNFSEGGFKFWDLEPFFAGDKLIEAVTF
jgi:hypothetical protein